MIVASSALLVMVSLLLAPVANLGLFYLGVASVLGIGFLYLALQTNMRKPLSAAWRFHSYSIIYIGLLFAAMIANVLVF